MRIYIRIRPSKNVIRIVLIQFLFFTYVYNVFNTNIFLVEYLVRKNSNFTS